MSHKHEGKLYSERREHPRFGVDLPVRFQAVDEKREAALALALRKAAHGKTRNLSLGGACLVSPHPVSEGEVLRLEILLPDDLGTVYAFAETIWSKDGVHGLKFLNLKEQDSEALRRYLRTLPPPEERGNIGEGHDRNASEEHR